MVMSNLEVLVYRLNLSINRGRTNTEWMKGSIAWHGLDLDMGESVQLTVLIDDHALPCSSAFVTELT